MLIGEYDASGNILDRYVPGPGTDEAVLWYQGPGTANANWLHADNQGSTIAWSDGAGNGQGTQAYDPFGQPQSWSGPRYAYTGQLMLPEAQLYDYKARAYDPALGRFLQTDPIGYASDINPYAYVFNGPMSAIDPRGMVTELSGAILPISEDPSNETGAPTCDSFGNCLSGSPLTGVTVTAAYNPGYLGPGMIYSNVLQEGPGGGVPNGAPKGSARGTPQNNQKGCSAAGNAPSPGTYAQLGQIAGSEAYNVPFGTASAAGMTLGFFRGGPLDAQAYGANHSYGNYAFGVYMASAGIPLSLTLSAANVYGALFSHYGSSVDMDSNYTNIPSANVRDITNGYNAYKNGTTCGSGG